MTHGAAAEGGTGEGGAGKPLVLSQMRWTARDAEAFARIVHEGQQDRAGQPYWRHLERVADLADDNRGNRLSMLSGSGLQSSSANPCIMAISEAAASGCIPPSPHRTAVELHPCRDIPATYLPVPESAPLTR